MQFVQLDSSSGFFSVVCELIGLVQCEEFFLV